VSESGWRTAAPVTPPEPTKALWVIAFAILNLISIDAATKTIIRALLISSSPKSLGIR